MLGGFGFSIVDRYLLPASLAIGLGFVGFVVGQILNSRARARGAKLAREKEREEVRRKAELRARARTLLT